MEVGFAGFPPEAVKFLRQLKQNNNRTWFLAHKEVYEDKVKTPMTDLVISLGAAMQSFAPEMVVDPRKAIYRIYRDIRFSPDKSPYKTHIAAHFAPHGMPKDSSASFYFHISPDEVLIAGGSYMPDSERLRKIRNRIASNPQEFNSIIGAHELRRLMGKLQGDQLQRPPKGFPPDHPATDLLRYKQHLFWVSHPPKLAESPKILPLLLKSFAAMTPFVRYLNATAG